jgi:hypothetical protein
MRFLCTLIRRTQLKGDVTNGAGISSPLLRPFDSD